MYLEVHNLIPVNPSDLKPPLILLVCSDLSCKMHVISPSRVMGTIRSILLLDCSALIGSEVAAGWR